MKLKNEIFAKKLLSVVAVMAVLSTPAFAAVGNGCDEDSDNEYINPELALCSTHVYNVGGLTNPPTDAGREVMRDVVALKTTIITQQMYKQYEYLESMMKRFKTQLEKAVLTTKLQAAGADTSSTSSSLGGSLSIKSKDSNIQLAGAQNCMTTTTFQNAYSCLTSNIQLVLNAVNGGNNIGEAKRQLEKDLGVAVTWGIIYKNSATDNKYSTSDTSKTGLDNCNTMTNSNRSNIIQCAQQFNVAIAKHLDSRQQKQNALNWNNQNRNN